MARKGDGVFKRGNSWRLDCIIAGKRHIITLGRKINRKAALAIAGIKRGEILMGEAGAVSKKQDLSFKEARRLYFDWVKANKAQSTQNQYEDCLDRLENEFGDRKLSQINAFMVEGYKQRRVKAGAPVCANRELGTLRAMYNWLAKYKKYQGENPASRFEKVKESRGKTRILTPEEEAALLNCASEPVRSLIIIGLNCGIRVQREGLTLQWPNVDFNKPSIVVEAAFSKNHERREIPLNSIALETLLRLRKESPGPWVFMTRGRRKGGRWRKLRNFRTAFETACRNAKLSGDVTPHTLRHTWASRLEGTKRVSTKTLMELGGWSDPKMVARYSHSSEEQRKSAVDLLVKNSTPSTTPEAFSGVTDDSAKLLKEDSVRL